MGRTKELEIPKEYIDLCKDEYDIVFKDNKVEIKRFLRGDVVKIEQQALKVKTNASGTGMSADFNSSDYIDLTNVTAIVKAPWTVNDLNAYRQLPTFLTDWLTKEITEFNRLEVKKKENQKGWWS